MPSPTPGTRSVIDLARAELSEVLLLLYSFRTRQEERGRKSPCIANRERENRGEILRGLFEARSLTTKLSQRLVYERGQTKFETF